MRKKSFYYVWSLLVVMLTMTACSSDLNNDADLSTKTGTVELNFAFEGTSGKTRTSTAIPTTSWDNVKQIQFFLYDGNNKVVFSSIVTPSGGRSDGSGDKETKTYAYTAIPVGEYTLVALANAKSSTDSITTYTGSIAQTWTEGNVFNTSIKDLSIGHRRGSWNSTITDNATAKKALEKLTPYRQPSEVFMGYATGINIAANKSSKADVALKREVSLMRVRIDQKTHTEAANVDFAVDAAAVMLYCLPDRMGIGNDKLGGVGTASTKTNALFVPGAFTAGTANDKYTEGNYSLWKDVIVFPNNGGRVNNANTKDAADASRMYFIVLCGKAKAGHKYSGGATATEGDPVFWYGQIKEVFTPNVIREVNLILKTGGSSVPPEEIVEYGGLEVVVSHPAPWDSNIVTSEIEM